MAVILQTRAFHEDEDESRVTFHESLEAAKREVVDTVNSCKRVDDDPIIDLEWDVEHFPAFIEHRSSSKTTGDVYEIQVPR